MTKLDSSPHEPDPLALDQQLCFQFYAASNLITRLYRPRLAKLGLTYPQYLVMLVLWEHDGLSVGALSSRLHLDNATVTPLIKRMEALGLLNRTRDPDDERRVLVTLTDDGRALREQAVTIPETMAQGQNVEELNSLRLVLQDMVRSLAEMQP